MGTLWPRSSSLEWDNNGNLAEGALAYFYEAGTSTPKAVYQDGAEGTAHEFPLEADSGRWPAVFVPFGTYKVVIKTAAGTTLFSADEVPNPEPFDATFELDETAIYNTGDYIFVGKNGTRNGAVRCNGRTIGDASSGATERANADTTDLYAYLWDNYANGQAAVSTGRGATAAADFAAHKTIALPDHRGAHLVGFDDMGNTAASLLGAAPVVSGSGILPGSIIGANTHTLLTAELATHAHSVVGTSETEGAHNHAIVGNTGTESADHTHTGTTATESATHTHSYNTPSNKASTATGVATTGGTLWNGLDTAATSGTESASHTHTFTTGGISANHTHTVNFTSAAGSAHSHSISLTSGTTGNGTAHNNLSRSIPVTVLMKL
jgi:hypothetical protein